MQLSEAVMRKRSGRAEEQCEGKKPDCTHDQRPRKQLAVGPFSLLCAIVLAVGISLPRTVRHQTGRCKPARPDDPSWLVVRPSGVFPSQHCGVWIKPN